MINELAKIDSSWQSHSETLIENYNFLRIVEQLQQLTTLAHGSVIKKNDDQLNRIAQILNTDTNSLFTKICNILQLNQTLLKKLDPRETGH